LPSLKNFTVPVVMSFSFIAAPSVGALRARRGRRRKKEPQSACRPSVCD
jgi:hypothetical protein